jgi:hypothetical protein
MGDGTHAEVIAVAGGLTYAEVVLTLDTDAYADGDVLFDTQELAGVCPGGAVTFRGQ